MKLHMHEGRMSFEDLRCCSARRWWRTAFLCLWLVLPLIAGALLVRWDVDRSRALAWAQNDAAAARLEASCWRRLVERNAPAPSTYLQRVAFVKGCVKVA